MNVDSKESGSGVRIVRVGDERDGQRIDNFLAGQLKGVPKSLIYRLLRTGQVRVNGKRAKPDTRIAEGDDVRIPPVRTAAPGAVGTPAKSQMQRIEDAVIHEDRDFLVLDKPSGVASHGGSGVSFGAIELLRAARPGDTLELAHRLDRDTSGVLVFARKRAALTGLQELIRDGQITKQYLALLCGHPLRSKFEVNAPLRKSTLQGGERMVRVDEAGKPALTAFRVIDGFAEASLAEVTLYTGRTHQIRVHAQHTGHPVAGDEKYGQRDCNQAFRASGLRRLFLHAARFEFTLAGKTYSFSAPLATDLAAVLDALPRRTGSGKGVTGKSVR
ncbi:MAG: RluA family pseudouridine synthase [Rudaea sp.]|nr:RluA family pseudouridine synthase [Rudaea sp.]